MLSTFPILLSYQFAVPFVFRLVIGLVLVWSGYNNFKSKDSEASASVIKLKDLSEMWQKIIAAIEIIGGILLFIGLFTQVAAIILSIVIATSIIIEHRKNKTFSLEQQRSLLLLLITVSLLFLGPGFYSLDLPI